MLKIVFILVLQLVYVPILALRTISMVKKLKTLTAIVGIEVENKIAIGFTSFEVNINNENEELINDLRQLGYGVTLYEGQGRESSRYQLDILTRRSKERELIDLIAQYEPNAFIMAFEPTRFKGGYIEAIMKNRAKRNS